jgi:hypothetical protein
MSDNKETKQAPAVVAVAAGERGEAAGGRDRRAT